MYKFLIKKLLIMFHMLPPGLKLFIRSFKNQEPELYELNWLVGRDSIAIDIGANNGSYTYAISRLIGKKGMVVSIEPISYLYEYLKKACKQLRIPGEVHQLCLSSKKGESKLFIPESKGGEPLTGLASLELAGDSSGQYQKINLETLDNLLKKRTKKISFIKCDVEGHEIEVFKGAHDILTKDRPNLLVEIEEAHSAESIYKRFNFFFAYNYNGYFLDRDNALTEIKKFKVEIHQNTTTDNDKNNYIYNFIFLPAEKPLPERKANK